MNQNNKQYNNYYIDVIYENRYRRLYDELTTDSYTALFSETQIKIIELIENFNFKVFYVSSEPKSNLKVSFIKSEYVNLNDNNVIKIKQLLSEDIYFLYEHQLFEVLYTIPKLNKNNNYSFDMILVVNQKFDLNKLYSYNFNLINIFNVQPINKETITYEWVENIFKKRSLFHNSSPTEDEGYITGYYNIDNIILSEDNFIKYYNNGDDKFDLDKFHNASSPIFYSGFNQNLYAKSIFMLLDMQIWSLDKFYIKVRNKFGYRICYLETYNVNSVYITNFAELINCNSVNLNDKKNKFIFVKEHCYYSTLSSNFYDQCIINSSLDKNSIKTGFADLSNLELKEEWETIV